MPLLEGTGIAAICLISVFLVLAVLYALIKLLALIISEFSRQERRQ
ncbi:MAG TPA: hypothetical protein VN608_00105 [Clostridia bacterium]|nr:hypothetical protein [Clostridia bacterium]